MTNGLFRWLEASIMARLAAKWPCSGLLGTSSVKSGKSVFASKPFSKQCSSVARSIFHNFVFIGLFFPFDVEQIPSSVVKVALQFCHIGN